MCPFAPNSAFEISNVPTSHLPHPEHFAPTPLDVPGDCPTHDSWQFPFGRHWRRPLSVTSDPRVSFDSRTDDNDRPLHSQRVRRTNLPPSPRRRMQLP